MPLSAQLQQATELARDAGLPVETVEKLYAERMRPWLIKRLAPRVIAFVQRTGVRIVALEAGRVVCEMPLKRNVNHIGTMYAGALFTLAEFPGGPLMLATFGLRRFIPIVTRLDMEFLRVAKGPVRVELTLDAEQAAEIEARTLAEGKAEFELHGELRDLQGELVARSHARYQMRPRRR